MVMVMVMLLPPAPMMVNSRAGVVLGVVLLLRLRRRLHAAALALCSRLFAAMGAVKAATAADAAQPAGG